MDKITVEGARFCVHLGVTKEERVREQEIIVDFILFFNTQLSAQTEDISDTIDYYPVCQRIGELLKKQEYKLIETVAERIAQNILKSFKVRKILVRVRKQHALSFAQYAAVEIVREAEQPIKIATASSGVYSSRIKSNKSDTHE